jgi:hypothetical protein
VKYERVEDILSQAVTFTFRQFFENLIDDGSHFDHGVMRSALRSLLVEGREVLIHFEFPFELESKRYSRGGLVLGNHLSHVSPFVECGEIVPQNLASGKEFWLGASTLKTAHALYIHFRLSRTLFDADRKLHSTGT